MGVSVAVGGISVGVKVAVGGISIGVKVAVGRISIGVKVAVGRISVAVGEAVGTTVGTFRTAGGSGSGVGVGESGRITGRLVAVGGSGAPSSSRFGNTRGLLGNPFDRSGVVVAVAGCSTVAVSEGCGVMDGSCPIPSSVGVDVGDPTRGGNDGVAGEATIVSGSVRSMRPSTAVDVVSGAGGASVDGVTVTSAVPPEAIAVPPPSGSVPAVGDCTVVDVEVGVSVGAGGTGDVCSTTPATRAASVGVADCQKEIGVTVGTARSTAPTESMTDSTIARGSLARLTMISLATVGRAAAPSRIRAIIVGESAPTSISLGASGRRSTGCWERSSFRSCRHSAATSAADGRVVGSWAVIRSIRR